MSVAVGVLFLAASIACVVAFGVAIATLADPDLGGFLQSTGGFGVVLFGAGAVALGGVGWFLAGDAVRRRLRRRRA